MNTEPNDPIPVRKAGLRDRFRAYRQALPENEYSSLSRIISDRAASLPELRGASCVHVYWPMIERHEIDTRGLIARLEAQDVEIVLPVVARPVGGEAPVLEHVRFPGVEGLRVNRWGISEPSAGEPVDVEVLDAVIVPALGAGRNGHRVGFGRGYYDAFLSGVDALRICLVYDACLVDHVPAEPHDGAMDLIVTEKEVLRIRRPGRDPGRQSM